MAESSKRRRNTDSEKAKRRRKAEDDDSDSELLFKDLLKSEKEIVETLKEFSTSSASTSKTLALSDVSLSSACREVADLPLSAVQSAIETLVLKATHSIIAGNGFSFQVPSRSGLNQLYVPELDRIVLKDQTTLRPFANSSTVRKTTMTNKILSLIHQLCLEKIHVTKRDLFYTDVKLFQQQRE